MKKHNQDMRDLIYVHLNQTDQSVMSYGIEFQEFYSAFSDSLNHLLLLKHRFDDGDFNMHTLLEYVPRDRIDKLASDNVYGYGNFCWIDFAEVEGLNELTGQETAELLYLGHLKQHLKIPFYNQLNNRFAYLAHDDGWFNKTYYRSMKDFYDLLSMVIALKLSHLKYEKSLFGIRKKRTYPAVNKELLLSLTPLLKEGICFSIRDAETQRAKVEIPIWIMGDFDNMDDMYDEYEQISRTNCYAKLVFDKKTKEWKLQVL
ncbi:MULTISPECIES: hypothetical protein [unclassified Bacillus (in: firmicutes)]|uniref:hypothetical protein n=1 Tax=unclassified Bacillus (in: firmicutes) TaxID=185979 RepID=UPI0008F33A47|nr:MULTISPECIES: hypothetical protein [unclassified Bacillus (in: firmicutes)]SFB24242.1 hypothetical protein SAMN02799634_11235 [Bacillus sp. UNCCL13]SFQ91363.1 hypothetical protein SAMN04488577_0036 [Bacillus sp. cl95]